MTTPARDAPAQAYQLRPSRMVLVFEMVFFGVVLVSILLILSDGWLLSAVLLYSLLAIKFFTRLSVMRQFAQPCSLEIRMKPRPLICYYQQGELCFTPDQVTVKISRWIVILKMVSSEQRIERILLVDNFKDKKQYSRFRRQIFEMLDVS